jgi:segregation and condensation protein A
VPYEVHTAVFEGPFDLLLHLIAKHKLDVTEVALAQVTDDFLGYLADADTFDLGAATEFLVIASTLLDLKAARLLPQEEPADDEDVALLEARDLLFARLLQYRAFKSVAQLLAELDRVEARFHPRAVALEPQFASLLPEVALDLGPEGLARVAAHAFTPKPPPVVDIEHVHAPRVSVREQAARIRERLLELGTASFALLVAECRERIEVVASFLAVLELYREGVLRFEQPEPFAELVVRWVGEPDREQDPDEQPKERA